MKKYTAIITQYLLITFLTNTAVGMEQNNNLCIFSSLLKNFHNQKQSVSLKADIKSYLQLRITCKQVKDILSLKVIGEHLNRYDQITKDNTLYELLKYLKKETYSQYKNAAIILIHSGADDNKNERYFFPTLLERAAVFNDIDTIKTLFNNGAKPDQRNLLCPVFFKVKNIAVAQEFLNRGFNIHTTNWGMINVLWYIIAHNHPSSLIQFYLDLGVNVQELDSESGTCVAHYFADFLHKSFDYTNVTEFDNYVKKCRLLLNAAPDILSIKDNKRKTPLDQAKKYLAKETNATNKKLIQTIIDLFKEYQNQ